MGAKEYFSCFFITLCIGVKLSLNLNYQWDLVKLSDLTSSSTPEYVTDSYLFCIRLIYLSIILTTVLFMLFDRTGFKLKLMSPQDKLIDVHLIGIQRFAAFTVWNWALQLFYFMLITFCTYIDKLDPTLQKYIAPYQWLLTRVAWGAFEIAFTMAFLVTIVVTFILIPSAIRKNAPYDNFYKVFPLLMHNFNVIFMVSELFLNKLPIILHHNSLCFFWGMTYTMFAMYWYWLHGYFFYFFLDFHKPFAPIWTLILIAIYSALFTGGHYLSNMIRDSSNANATLYKWSIAVFTVFIMKWPPREKWHITTQDLCYYFPSLAPNKSTLANDTKAPQDDVALRRSSRKKST